MFNTLDTRLIEENGTLVLWDRLDQPAPGHNFFCRVVLWSGAGGS